MQRDIHATGIAELQRLLARGQVTVKRETARITKKHGSLLVTKIRARASGRPGPGVVTGDYRRSWGSTYRATPDPSATVGTNAPQARRLEYGFTGRDSLGRHYAQPPLPHVAPAVQETEAEYKEELRRMAARIDSAVAYRP
jgi:hypothetical protein